MANNFAADPSCVAWWRFEPGALTTDSIGTNTLVASASAPTSDTVNFQEGTGSVAFNAANSQYYVIRDANLSKNFPYRGNMSNPGHTFSFKFKLTNAANNQRIYFKHYDGQRGIILDTWGGNLRLIIGSSGWGDVTWNIFAPTSGRWYHAVITTTMKGQAAYIYDYVTTTTTTYTNTPNGGGIAWGIPFGCDMFIGSTTGTADFFTGNLDSFAIFNRAVSAAEAAQIIAGTFNGRTQYWCIDPVNGNDSTGDGLTWGTAWKSTNHAYIGAGDNIYVAKSPETTATGTVTATNGSVSVTTTNDLTSVCPQYTVIRISGDNALYMVKAITSNTITLYRPYRGTTGSSKGLTYYASLPTTYHWVFPALANQFSQINMLCGVNTSNNQQDGFTVFYGANNDYFWANTTTLSNVNVSNMATLYYMYGWGACNHWDSQLSNIYCFRNQYNCGYSWTIGRCTVNTLVTEEGKWGAGTPIYSSVINDLQTAETGAAGWNANNILQWSTINGWRNAGYTNQSVFYLNQSCNISEFYINNAVFDELGNNPPNIGTYAYVGSVPWLVFRNPRLSKGALQSNYAGGYNWYGCVAFQNINGDPNNNIEMRSFGDNFWWQQLLTADPYIYHTAAPSRRVNFGFLGNSWAAGGPFIEKFFIPCDAGVTKTISVWVMKNSAPINTITINTAGSNYAVGDLISITQSNASGTILRVNAVSGGGVTGVDIYSAGMNHSVANALDTTTLSGSGSGCKINITSLGTGYGTLTRPKMRLTWPTGTGLNQTINTQDVIMPDVDNTWQQLSYTVTPSVIGTIVVEIIGMSWEAGAQFWYDDFGVI